MAKFSIDSKLKELLKDPGACAILEQYAQGITTSPRVKMAGSFTFRKVAAFPQLSFPEDKLAEIDEKLQALG